MSTVQSTLMGLALLLPVVAVLGVSLGAVAYLAEATYYFFKKDQK